MQHETVIYRTANNDLKNGKIKTNQKINNKRF